MLTASGVVSGQACWTVALTAPLHGFLQPVGSVA
jgi:hypothetical protein